MCGLALQAVRTVAKEVGEKTEVDIKRYAKVEKIPGGEIEDSRVLDGVMVNKDITHPKMRRRIENPRVVLLDCSLEYKKGESQTNIEISREEDWSKILEIEEQQVKTMCDHILAVKPDLVITEKGVSGTYFDHFLQSPRPGRVSGDCNGANAAYRSRTTLPAEGQCHRSPPCPKN